MSERWTTRLASKEKDDDEVETVDRPDMTEKKQPSMIDKISFNIFKLFSYGIQFLGAFFGVGLLLNLCGFGYRFDLKHGLVVDRIQNMRNEVQFEREIEREERADLKGSASSKYITAPIIPENDIASTGDQ